MRFVRFDQHHCTLSQACILGQTAINCEQLRALPLHPWSGQCWHGSPTAVWLAATSAAPAPAFAAASGAACVAAATYDPAPSPYSFTSGLQRALTDKASRAAWRQKRRHRSQQYLLHVVDELKRYGRAVPFAGGTKGELAVKPSVAVRVELACPDPAEPRNGTATFTVGRGGGGGRGLQS